MSKILVLPDVQAKPGTDFTYLNKIGRYMVDKKPDTVVCLGDFADMPSLSSYDQGKKSFEGRRYIADIEAAKDAMCAFLSPLWEFNAKAKKNKEKQYHPRMVLTLGNHENRINRAVNDDPKLEGVLSVDALGYEGMGWEVVPFLDVIVIDGVAFSHYFVTGLMGRPVTSAAACLTKKHQSVIQGHQQGLQIATGYKADGSLLTSVIAGSCLAPHHKVLTADLRYIPLSEVKVGDQLTSFDEHLGMSAKRSRRFKTGTVTAIRTSIGELFDVTLSNGKVFTTTKDHRWLTKNCMGVTKWQETQNLTTHKLHVNQNTKVARVLPEWEEELSKEAGWLAGMYDGEGTLYARKTTGGNCTQLSISQCPVHNPDTVQLLEEVHNKFGYGFTTGTKTGRNCKQWRIPKGQGKVAKFLGSIRPQRLLSKFRPELLGTLTTQYEEPLDSVISVVSRGIGEYVEIEIDAATMVVEGYPHHNCYEHNEDYMSWQSNNHWRGFLMLHDVQDGAFDLMPVSLSYINKKYGH